LGKIANFYKIGQDVSLKCLHWSHHPRHFYTVHHSLFVIDLAPRRWECQFM